MSLPKETVRQFLSQDAIQQLFISIITDSIISFNKKVNPLSGLTAALGMEKQIKNFLQPFMGNVINSSTDFVVSDKNKQLFTKMSVSLFDIVKKERAKPYLEAINSAKKEKLDAFTLALTKDPDLLEFNQNLIKHIIDNFFKEVKDKKVTDFFEISPQDFADKWSDITIDILLPLLQEDVVVEYLAAEVQEITS